MISQLSALGVYWTLLFLLFAELIDGKAIAATIRQETAAEVAALKEKTGKVLRKSCLTTDSYSLPP